MHVYIISIIHIYIISVYIYIYKIGVYETIYVIGVCIYIYIRGDEDFSFEYDDGIQIVQVS